MITFKQFVTEAMLKPWVDNPVLVKEAINFLNKNCKDGLKAISNNGLIYRGFMNKVSSKKFLLLDSTNAERSSRDSNNVYQMLLDASIHMKEMPSRSNSFICSSDRDTAYTYGEPYVMIPVDGTKIAVGGYYDMLLSDLNSSIFTGDMQDINLLGADMLNFLGAKKPSSIMKFENAREIRDAFDRYSSEEIVCFYDHVFCDNKMIHALYLNLPKPLDQKQLTKKEIIAAANVLAKNKTTLNMFKNQKIVHAAMEANPKNKFQAFASLIMTPKSTDITVKTFGEVLPTNREVWFSGKAMAIPYDLFLKMLLELKKQGHPVHSAVKREWEIKK